MDIPTAPAPHPVTPPALPLPEGAIDCHMHPVGDDYPLSPNAVERPTPGTLDAWLDTYAATAAGLGCSGGIAVHSILYGADNAITLEALRRMGPNHAAVCLITDDATPGQIAALAQAGARAVRLNYVHGGLLSWEAMTRLAPVLSDNGLHVEMLAHSHRHLAELAPRIPALPVPIVFDHCAWPDPSLGVTEGQLALERLLAEGRAWCKLSATYRFTDDPRALVARLAAANPERLVWGSDWPHLMLNGLPMADAGAELAKVLDVLSTDDRRRVFVDNPQRLYRLQA